MSDLFDRWMNGLCLVGATAFVALLAGVAVAIWRAILVG